MDGNDYFAFPLAADPVVGLVWNIKYTFAKFCHAQPKMWRSKINNFFFSVIHHCPLQTTDRHSLISATIHPHIKMVKSTGSGIRRVGLR